MLNNFIYAQKKSLFTKELETGNVLDEAIVFIEDTKEIWNHGTYFDCSTIDLSNIENSIQNLQQNKQDTLVSETNIKTINGESLLGSGDISIKSLLNWSIIDPFNGHEYVDLGLPSGTLWAKCNIGASSPEESGDYFAWGETAVKSDYASSNSITLNLHTSELLFRGIVGIDGNLTAAYDAATVNWGDNWRMPTLIEILELIGNCICEWTSMNGVYGRKVTGPNGNSIFIPVTGYRNNTLLSMADFYGSYWSATTNSNNNDAYYLYFYLHNCSWSSDFRYYGRVVRPVTNKFTSITVDNDTLVIKNGSLIDEIILIQKGNVNNEILNL